MLELSLTFPLFLIIIITVINVNFVDSVENAQMCCPPIGGLFYQNLTCTNGTQKRFPNCTNGAFTLSENDNFLISKQDGYLYFSDIVFGYQEFCYDYDESNNESIVAVVCFPPDETDQPIQIQFPFLSKLRTVSFICLLITVAIYTGLQELRHDLLDVCITHAVANLFILYFITEILKYFSLNQLLCAVKAHSLYFFTWCMYIWLNVCCFNLWTSSRDRMIERKRALKFYCIFSYGFSVIYSILCVFVVKLFYSAVNRPNFELCTINDKYIPVILILLIDLYFLIDCQRLLWSKNNLIDPSYKVAIQSRVNIFIKLFIPIFIQRMLQIITIIFKNQYFLLFLVNVINSIEGIIIFIMLVVVRKNTLTTVIKRLRGL